MRLHVGVVGPEQFLRSVDGQLFGDIDVLTTTIVALARIAFSVLVGQHRALCFQDTWAGVVLGRDQLDMVFLTLPFAVDGLGELRVKAGDVHGLCEHDGAFVTEGETEPRIVPEYMRTARSCTCPCTTINGLAEPHRHPCGTEATSDASPVRRGLQRRQSTPGP